MKLYISLTGEFKLKMIANIVVIFHLLTHQTQCPTTPSTGFPHHSSLAPTRDGSGSKFPAATKRRVWWDKLGRQAFGREFAREPGISHVFKTN
jgi:hypothetical protein